MDAGKLDKRLRVLSYDGEWTDAFGAWASMEEKDRIIYSALATSKQGAKFVMRTNKITPANLILFGAQYYAIGSVQHTEGYVTVTAAEVEPIKCTASAPSITYDELNFPTYGTSVKTEFYGILAEKYVNWKQEQPNASLELGVILVTPKQVELASGDVVTANGKEYAVTACHLMDKFRNEYEIAERTDA